MRQLRVSEEEGGRRYPRARGSRGLHAAVVAACLLGTVSGAARVAAAQAPTTADSAAARAGRDTTGRDTTSRVAQAGPSGEVPRAPWDTLRVRGGDPNRILAPGRPGASPWPAGEIPMPARTQGPGRDAYQGPVTVDPPTTDPGTPIATERGDRRRSRWGDALSGRRGGHARH